MRRSALKLMGGLFMLLLTTAPLLSRAQSTKGIVFMEDAWTAALKKAAQQKKYVFVDAYATWCGPCKMLKKTTFVDKTAAAFYNKNFVNLAMDMEKGQGPALAAQWALEAYPTLLIFDSKGKLVLKSVGFIQAPDLIKFGKQALAAKKS